MFFPGQCWSCFLLLHTCAFCLVTICAPFLEAGHRGTRAEGTRLTNEDLYGHHHSHSEVKDLSVRAYVIHPEFLCDRSTFLAYLGQEFVQMKTLPGKKSIFKMQISSCPCLPNFLTCLFSHFLAKGLFLYHFLFLECSSHPSSLVTNFLTILAISVQAYPPHSSLDLLD